MFKELSPLLRKGDSLAITVSRESDTNLRLTVTPKLFTLDGEHGPDRKSLNVPLTITGTIEVTAPSTCSVPPSVRLTCASNVTPPTT